MPSNLRMIKLTSLQNGALSATGYKSVRIRICTTTPDPSLRNIILLYNYIYIYPDLSFSTCPLALDQPRENEGVHGCTRKSPYVQTNVTIEVLMSTR